MQSRGNGHTILAIGEYIIMIDFKTFLLEHLPATISAILGVVGSIITIFEAVKKHGGKKVTQFLVICVFFLIILLASILYLFAQYHIATTNVLNLEADQYNLGIMYYEKQEYERAITEFQNIPEESIYYVDAQTYLLNAINQYRTNILNTADTYAQQQDYRTAIGILNEALLIIPGNTEVTNAIRNYTNTIRDKAITDAGTLAAAGDFISAFQIVQSTIDELGSDSELNVLLVNYQESYAQNVLQQVSIIYNESGYDAVVALLKEATSILPNNTNLKEEFDLWNSRHSVPLTDIEYFSKSGSIQEDYWVDGTDNYGTAYPHSITPFDSGTTYIEYYLGGQYAKLSGVLYVTSHAKSINPSYYTWGIATISIYGDDILLYTNTGFTTKDQPMNISVDISEVDFLKISFENAHYFDTGMSESLIGLGNPTIGW